MALAIDGALMGFLGIGVLGLVTIAAFPFWTPGDTSAGTGGGDGRALDGVLPSWLSWVMLGALATLALGLSGALSRSGPRTSHGLRFCELEVVLASAARSPAGGPPPADLPGVAPARWRVAARWLVPFGLFALGTYVVGGFWAAVVVLGAWAPALLGDRRSLYDVLAGVDVVDGVRMRRRRMARARQKST